MGGKYSIQLLRNQNYLLSFVFWVYLGFRVWGLEFIQPPIY